jgi:nitroreductase
MVAHGRTGVRCAAMDAFLAVASRREVRRYADRPIEPAVERRILEAGRVSGSSKNRQPWRFVVLAEPDTRARAADAVWNGDNVRGAALVVAVVVAGKGPVTFDAGRAAQNMLLAAWAAGVGACPNGISDPEAMGTLLGLGEDERFAIVLSFGYPARPVDVAARTAEEWLERADRRPLDELVERR